MGASGSYLWVLAVFDSFSSLTEDPVAVSLTRSCVLLIFRFSHDFLIVAYPLRPGSAGIPRTSLPASMNLSQRTILACLPFFVTPFQNSRRWRVFLGHLA